MTIKISYVIAYFLSVFGGWLIAGICVYVMRKSIRRPREFFRWIDLWVGGTERAVATTLVLFAHSYLPAFIGGWIALKFAANWKRRNVGAGQASLVFLVGSVISFAVAIGAALYMRPDLIEKLTN
jgi:hypothetical protein